MPIIKVKPKGQVTLPTTVREEVGLHVGDILEAKVECGRVVLTPKTLIDRRLAEGLTDVKKGRVYGPFTSAHTLLRSLREETKKGKVK